MKKSIFMSIVAAMALTACSSDEPLMDANVNDNNETLEAGNHYLSINIVAAPGNGGGTATLSTRAIGDPNGSATYEDGIGNENEVKAVRFYFFDNEGNAACVKADGSNNVYFLAPGTGNGDAPNVEKKVNALIVISTKEGDKFPSQIVAVVNPDEEGLDGTTMDLPTLRARHKNYVATAKGDNGAFVMINSVYSQNGEISTTAVTRENYGENETEAKNSPVNIYVERAVAKVRVKLGANLGVDANNRIALKDAEGKNIVIDGQQIYLQLSKWNLTAETNEGWLSKHINTSWASDLFGAEPWNWEPYFRSYWASSYANPVDNQLWHPYNDIIANGKEFGTDYIYTNENTVQTLGLTKASEGADIEPLTKVIMAGTLVDATGKAIDVVKYAGASYAGTQSLKALLLDNLANSGMIYSYTTNGTNVTFSSLKDEDVDFITAEDADIAGVTESEKTNGRYNVYLQLSQTGAAKNWTKNANPDTYEAGKFTDNASVNSYLATVWGPAQIYKNGLTYYYFPIRHLGESGKVGYYGVVRNHIYDCTVNSITGLGTPVYDPEQTVYPEKPKDENTYIAAVINILSWRVVPNDYDLDW